MNREFMAGASSIENLAPTAARTSTLTGTAVDVLDYDGGAMVVLDSAAGTGDTLTTNGGFGSDTGWTKGTGWTIAAGVASCDGTQTDVSDLEQNQALTEGVSYTVTYTLSSVTAGSITPRLGGTAGVTRTANGTYTEVITCGAGVDPKLELRADADFVGNVDNVAVYDISLAAKIQHCETSDGSFADVTGATFSTVRGIASQQKIAINLTKVKRYIKLIGTIAGTNPSFTFSGNLIGLKQNT